MTNYTTAVTLLICMTLSCIIIQKKYKSWILTAAWFYFGFSAARIFGSPWPTFPQYPKAFSNVMDYHSLYAAFAIVISASIALIVPRRTLNTVFKIIAYINIVMISSFWLMQSVFGYQIDGNPFNRPWGILMNASMSGSLAVSLIPLFLNNQLTILCSVLAAVLCGEDMPTALLGFGWIYYLWQKKSQYIGYAVGALICGVLFKLTDNVQSSGRFEVWKLSWDWWREYGNHWLGTGSGGFSVIGPVLTRKMDAIWLWMHSDWLQIGFEQGVVGLILALALFWKLIQSTRTKPEIRLGVILYALWMIANMPMRYVISSILGFYFVRLSLESEYE